MSNQLILHPKYSKCTLNNPCNRIPSCSKCYGIALSKNLFQNVDFFAFMTRKSRKYSSVSPVLANLKNIKRESIFAEPQHSTYSGLMRGSNFEYNDTRDIWMNKSIKRETYLGEESYKYKQLMASSFLYIMMKTYGDQIRTLILNRQPNINDKGDNNKF